MAQEYWEGKHFSFTQNRECEFFPCHKVSDPDDFNCLFCYCPLYALGDGCGGNYKVMEGGIKDCSDCTLPHSRRSYGYIIGKFGEISDIAKEHMKKEE